MKSEKLDNIHHIAIQVNNLAKAVNWYTDNFQCKISYQDDSWALLKFANTSLALVVPKQHPHHFAITKDDLTKYGKAVPHRDGTESVYINDLDGNYVEIIKTQDNYSGV